MPGSELRLAGCLWKELWDGHVTIVSAKCHFLLFLHWLVSYKNCSSSSLAERAFGCPWKNCQNLSADWACANICLAMIRCTFNLITCWLCKSRQKFRKENQKSPKKPWFFKDFNNRPKTGPTSKSKFFSNIELGNYKGLIKAKKNHKYLMRVYL